MANTGSTRNQARLLTRLVHAQAALTRSPARDGRRRRCGHAAAIEAQRRLVAVDGKSSGTLAARAPSAQSRRGRCGRGRDRRCAAPRPAGRPLRLQAAANSGRMPSSTAAPLSQRRGRRAAARSPASPTIGRRAVDAARQDVHARRADEMADEGMRRAARTAPPACPVCTTAPSCITTTLSAKVSASVWSCVT